MQTCCSSGKQTRLLMERCSKQRVRAFSMKRERNTHCAMNQLGKLNGVSASATSTWKFDDVVSAHLAARGLGSFCSAVSYGASSQRTSQVRATVASSTMDCLGKGDRTTSLDHQDLIIITALHSTSFEASQNLTSHSSVTICARNHDRRRAWEFGAPGKKEHR